MAEFMIVLLSLSFSGTFLFAVVYIATRLLRNRLSRRWQYYIWLIVILRFLIPFAQTGNLTNVLFRSVSEFVQDSTDMSKRQIMEEQTADAAAGAPAGISDTDAAETSAETMKEPRRIMHKDTASADTKSEHRIDAAWFLFFVWAFGAAFCFLRKVTAYRRFIQYLNDGNTEVSETEVLDGFSVCKERLPVKRKIEIYRNQALFSPIMTGFFHPCIIIPDVTIKTDEAVYIFMHELVHYKYGDMFYKWLVQLTICLHWFNPVIYFLGKKVNENCELACDEKVIGELNGQERKAYGDALLSFMKREKVYENPTASLTLSEGAQQLIERLGAIMDYKKKTKSGLFCAGLLTAVICFFFVTLGAYAGKKEPAETVEAEAAVTDDYSIINIDNIYYILTSDADIDDIPGGTATEGFVEIVLVKKSGYASIGPFLKHNFLSDVEKQCQYAVENGHLSPKEAKTIMEAAAEIEDSGFDIAGGLDALDSLDTLDALDDSDSFVEKWNEGKASYVQSCFYQDPYAIALGWNLRDHVLGDLQTVTQSVTLDDGTEMTVFFAEELKEYVDDPDALQAVAKLISQVKEAAADGTFRIIDMMPPAVEKPVIVDMIYIPYEEVNDFAQNAYRTDDVGQFSYVTDALTDEVREEYAERSYQDDKLSFFCILIDRLPQDRIDDYGRRCYEENKIDFFCMLPLSEEARQEIKERAKQDDKLDFYYMVEE